MPSIANSCDVKLVAGQSCNAPRAWPVASAWLAGRMAVPEVHVIHDRNTKAVTVRSCSYDMV
jgi:hypothetical protein